MTLSLLATVCNAYKVLVLGPMSAPSHFLYVSSFVRALLDRGHEVTYLTSNSLSKLNSANYSEILIDPPYDFFAHAGMFEIFILFSVISLYFLYFSFRGTSTIMVMRAKFRLYNSLITNFLNFFQ